MKFPFLLILFFLINNTFAKSQELYSKAYGNPKNPAIIYVHGGPRGNATLFEGTTASSLAKKGFYVIAYDRRGEGRSFDSLATFTFNEAINDLDKVLDKFHIKKATIIGHSFGGIVATLYTSLRSEKVERLILVGALFSQQETYNHILSSTKKLALAKHDEVGITQISLIKTLDRKSAEYRKLCYEIASRYKYFSMPRPTAESTKLQLEYQNSEFSRTNIRNDKAPLLFYKNERLVNIDTKKTLKKIQDNKVKLFGIYGKEDQIFSSKQIADIQNLIGVKNFELIDNCSHYPFVDQQEIFIRAILRFMS
ncbi:MAG: alpha/beta hydrolase [Pedobacter sp.]|nr:MAG: alpha/beta hydrolase [Pedobacter sp.]